MAREVVNGAIVYTCPSQLDGVSAGAIADQVWYEPIGEHAGAGSTGKALTDLSSPANLEIAISTLTLGD